MNTVEERHLNENQVLLAVVDQDLLPKEITAHLSVCRHCLSRKKNAEEAFFQLGQKARDLAPTPKKRPKLPAAASKNLFWRYLPASAFSVLLLSTIAWWGLFSPPPAQKSLLPESFVAETWEDERFMMEIALLSENALSEEYIRLVTTADSVDLDEGFFEFVVPSTDTQPLSVGEKIKGGPLC